MKGWCPQMHQNLCHGSGASGDFGPEKTRRRTEDQQAATHKCPVSSGFSVADEPAPKRFSGRVGTVVRRCTRTPCHSFPDLRWDKALNWLVPRTSYGTRTQEVTVSLRSRAPSPDRG